MRREVKALRDAAVQACRFQGVRFQEFLDRGLEDILERADTEGWSLKQMTTQVLARCCLTEGKYNGFQVAFLAVMTFLNEQGKSPGDQAYHDLAQILKTAGTLQAIDRWWDSHC
jgi:hypothetical protein